MKKAIQIDIIILSYAQTEELKQTTINCVNSLVNSENSEIINFNTIVIESEKSLSPYQYLHCKTIYTDLKFGYHRYMNFGISLSSSPFICLCNNDLIFHENWASEILKPFHQFVDVLSASPVCSNHHTKMGFKLNDGLKLGYRIGFEVAGWCLFVKRDIFRLIGKLDENYSFWFSDDDYANTLYVLNITHVLVTSSIVDHLYSKTLFLQTEERQVELTEKEEFYFGKKWNHRRGDNFVLIT